MADEKWIQGLQADMPILEAGHRVIGIRLGAVIDRLPLAVRQSDEDVEHVHQLRVNTRRAGAALGIFAETLPGKLARKLRRNLRAIRRAAGHARDWDVFLQMIRARSARTKSKPQQPGLDFLFGMGHGNRLQAQQILITEGAKRIVTLPILVQQALAEILNKKKVEGKTLKDHAVPMLQELVLDLERKAESDLTHYEELHQVRILGKKLRYAMELFDCCFVGDFRERIYPGVVQMQEILGDANDSYSTIQQLTGLQDRLAKTEAKRWPTYQPCIAAILKLHLRRLPEKRRQFQAWWKKWKASGLATRLHKMVVTSGG